MSFTDKLQQIEQLKAAIEKHGKLSIDVLNKINYKFRLEWNYTSNSMEGNSLTRQETRSVMVGNITVEGKPIKDVLEMKGHDEVIGNIIKMGRGELNISEKKIKEIHAVIVHEEDPEKKKQIGVWKKDTNYLYNYKNERFDFVAPADVPERMHQLINWLNAERDKIQRDDKDALHPVELAFQFHLDYISIHPFYDGNGRTVRILTNLILISYGYPPIYVKENEKGPYYQYLADIQGYGGSPDLFYDFMAGLLIRSLRIVLDAIEGKDIEEPDDLLKEISLWKHQLSDKVEALPKSNAIIVDLYEKSLNPLLELFRDKMHRAFHDLFSHWTERGWFNNSNIAGSDKTMIDEEIRKISKTGDSKTDAFGNPIQEINSIGLDIDMLGFKKDGTNVFNEQARIQINFAPYLYSISATKITVEKLYEQFLTKDEQNDFANQAVREVFQRIKLRMKNPPLSDLV